MSFNLNHSIVKLPSPFFFLSVTLAASLYGQAALSQVAPDTLTSLASSRGERVVSAQMALWLWDRVAQAVASGRLFTRQVYLTW